MATILVVSGDSKGDFYPLGRRTNVIGRAEALPIQLLDDFVSRKHLQIRFDKETNRYYAADMKSKHGVFINAGRINDETPLVDRDIIRIGRTTLIFTERNFDDRRSALSRFKKPGERMRPTRLEWEPEDRDARSEPVLCRYVPDAT
ncbi:MAG: FHA domain-containing protein [Phycisphaerales bacterium]|nr:MAG: FHA domain-containing protein [Phycisphaerales bacterium]